MDDIRYYKSVNGLMIEIFLDALLDEQRNAKTENWKVHFRNHTGLNPDNFSFEVGAWRTRQVVRPVFTNTNGRNLNCASIERLVRCAGDKKNMSAKDMGDLLRCLSWMEQRMLKPTREQLKCEWADRCRNKKNKRKQNAHLARLGFLFADPDTITRQLDAAVTKLETKETKQRKSA